MHTRLGIIGSFIVALIVALGFTPFFRMLAVRFDFMDHPEKKKAHAHPTPLLGGAAIYLAVMISLTFSGQLPEYFMGIYIGATMLLLLGLVDDKMGMMPEMKLCVQTLAALAAFKFGLHVTTIEDYYLSMFFTVFWIVGITNAFNLLDNLNGLSSGIAAIASLVFCIITALDHDFSTAILASSIIGACIGFLRYNFPRAHVFMGDAGSLVLGFLLACVAISGSWATDQIHLSLSIPIVILGYPIFDTSLVTVIRLLEKRSIFQGGKDHSSHILAMAGFRKKNAVLLIFSICAALGIGALVIKYAPLAIGTAALTVTAVAMFSFGCRLVYVRKKMVVMRNGKNESHT
ncbi:MAG: MraY family glycosyltransferase [Candidatus Omnitrophica bacterium]|nr:MraY family glycosyltransferase [Candidatus Omnitrophota bacterium]